jgi:predicted transcriptional regulator
MAIRKRMTPEELKKHREKLGMTMREISSNLEVSERFYLYRESGVRGISRMMEYAVRWMLHKNQK